MLILLILFSIFTAAVFAYLFDIRSLSRIKYIIGNIFSKDKHFTSILFQVDEKSKKNGGDIVAHVLKAHGVRHVFTLCGGHISPILVACENRDVRVVDTRHEATAVFAADAVARLTQSVGVAAVTAGPGVTNTITAVKNAQMAESPVLLLAGAAPTLLKNRGALQDIDQLALFRPLCKFTARVTTVKQIVPVISRAIQSALSDTPGPVFIEFPVDILYPYEIVCKEAGLIARPRTVFEKVLNGYLMWHINRQFAGAFPDKDEDEQSVVTPMDVHIAYATSKQIHSASRLIFASRKPLLLLGSQTTLPPISPAKLKATVEELGIPCYLGGMSRGLLGRDNRLQMRQNRRDALREADLVILAGAVCDFRLSYGRLLSRKSKIIAINRSYDQLTKNAGMFWKPTIQMQADVASTILCIGKQLNQMGYQGANDDWISTLRCRDDAKEMENAKKATDNAPDGNLNPLNVLRVFDQTLPEDTILVADGGDFVGSAAYIVRPRGPLQWLDPGAFGTLGVGGGFALGAKCVHPESPVWIIFGDGSCGFSLMEYDSYVRQGLPVASLVGNDACWGQIAREQIPMFQSSVAVNLAASHYEKAVEALGAEGEYVTKDGESDLKGIFERANQSMKDGKSVLINAIIGKTDFRQGSISV